MITDFPVARDVAKTGHESTPHPLYNLTAISIPGVHAHPDL